jgi:hypothetical protein
MAFQVREVASAFAESTPDRRLFAYSVLALFAGTATALNNPSGVSTYDADGTFYVSDTLNRVVRRVFRNGTTFIVAGILGSSGNGVSQLNFPRAITLIGNDVVIADSGSHAVRILYANSTLATLFGTLGAAANSGDGGSGTRVLRLQDLTGALVHFRDWLCRWSYAATNAKLNNEYSAVPDGQGGLLIRFDRQYALSIIPAAYILLLRGCISCSDFSNNVIRRRSSSGTASTACLSEDACLVDAVAWASHWHVILHHRSADYKGNGYAGDGGLPSNARSGNPTYVYIDGNTTWITEVQDVGGGCGKEGRASSRSGAVFCVECRKRAVGLTHPRISVLHPPVVQQSPPEAHSS